MAAKSALKRRKKKQSKYAADDIDIGKSSRNQVRDRSKSGDLSLRKEDAARAKDVESISARIRKDKTLERDPYTVNPRKDAARAKDVESISARIRKDKTLERDPYADDTGDFKRKDATRARSLSDSARTIKTRDRANRETAPMDPGSDNIKASRARVQGWLRERTLHSLNVRQQSMMIVDRVASVDARRLSPYLEMERMFMKRDVSMDVVTRQVLSTLALLSETSKQGFGVALTKGIKKENEVMREFHIAEAQEHLSKMLDPSGNLPRLNTDIQTGFLSKMDGKAYDTSVANQFETYFSGLTSLMNTSQLRELNKRLAESAGGFEGLTRTIGKANAIYMESMDKIEGLGKRLSGAMGSSTHKDNKKAALNDNIGIALYNEMKALHDEKKLNIDQFIGYALTELTPIVSNANKSSEEEAQAYIIQEIQALAYMFE